MQEDKNTDIVAQAAEEQKSEDQVAETEAQATESESENQELAVQVPENQDDIDDGIKEAQRVMKIKVFITIAAVLLIACLAIMNWDSDDGYFIKISTDEGQTWTYEIADTSIVENTKVTEENGKYKANFDGLAEGETEITLNRIAESDPNTILETRVYHVQVYENMKIVQKSVDREYYED